MKKQGFLILVLLALFLILAACQRPAAMVMPSPTSNPDTPMPSRSTKTLTRIAITPTLDARTGEAVKAAQNSTIAVQTESAGFYATSTAIVRQIQSTVTPRVFQTFPSPDGKWLAQVNIYDCVQIQPEPEMTNSYEVLKISTWTAAAQLLNCGGLGTSGLAGRFWSANSRFFYFTGAREGSPEGGGPWTPPISRFDTAMVKTESLGLARFSPNQQKIAGAQGSDLVIWEINSDAVTRFTGPVSDQTWVSWVAWSPDGKALAYLTFRCQGTYPCPSTLSLVNLTDQTTMQLLGESDPVIIQVEWQQPDMLKLYGAEYQTTYTYHLKDRALIIETQPTLTPTPR